MPPVVAASHATHSLHTDQTTEDIAVAAAGGDHAALAHLFGEFGDAVYRYFLVRTRDQHLSEDLSQATWVKVARAIRSYEPQEGARFTSWLFAVARSALSEHARQNRRRPSLYLDGDMLELDAADPADNAEEALSNAAGRKAAADLVAQALKALPAAQAQVLELRFFTGLSLIDTSEVIGKSLTATKQLQFRACKTLRDRLGGLDLSGLVHSTA